MRLRVHGIRIHVLARVHVHGVHALVPLDDKRLEAIESRLLDILDWYKLNLVYWYWYWYWYLVLVKRFKSYMYCQSGDSWSPLGEQKASFILC